MASFLFNNHIIKYRFKGVINLTKTIIDSENVILEIDALSIISEGKIFYMKKDLVKNIKGSEYRFGEGLVEINSDTKEEKVVCLFEDVVGTEVNEYKNEYEIFTKHNNFVIDFKHSCV